MYHYCSALLFFSALCFFLFLFSFFYFCFDSLSFPSLLYSYATLHLLAFSSAPHHVLLFFSSHLFSALSLLFSFLRCSLLLLSYVVAVGESVGLELTVATLSEVCLELSDRGEPRGDVLGDGDADVEVNAAGRGFKFRQAIDLR